MDEDEKEWEKLRQQVKDMRDAMVVNNAMILNRERRIKEHEEWLRENELALARHRENMVNLDEKLDRIGDLTLGGHTKYGN